MSRVDAAARRLTRGEFVARSGAAAVGASLALGPFARIARAARTDDYCYAACVKAARDALAAGSDRVKANVIRSVIASGTFMSLVDCVVLRADQYAQFYDRRAACKGPNCGDDQKYPPPPPPPPIQPNCGAPCAAGSSCQPCPSNAGGGICCLDIFPIKNGKSQCCP